MTMVKGVMIAINRGEPTLIFWRLEDLPEALRVADDIGLPLASPPDVEDEISSSSVAPWPISTWRTRVSGEPPPTWLSTLPIPLPDRSSSLSPRS